MVGSTFGHYRIDAELGRGGMGVVYRAHDLKLDRPVALKFLPEGVGTSAAESARLLSEARAAATLNHPNACTIHSIEESGGRHFIVMELVEGKTLHEIVRGHPLDASAAVGYARQIAEALHEAQAKGIVHRDVKSENIMIDARGRVRVMDFGLARLKGAARTTKTGSTVGTLAYMAPEQIQGQETDARADIFSFGVVLYEMLTGRLPFRGEHDAAVMYSIMNEDPEPLRAAAPDAPDRLASLVEKSLRKLPAERQQSFGEVLAELDAIAERFRTRSIPRQAASGPIAVPPPPAPAAAAAPQPPRKRRWLVPLLGVVAAGLLALAGLLLFRGGGDTHFDQWNRKDFAVIPVPASGRPWAGALTPDGKAIVYSSEQAGGWTIHVRQVATGSTMQIFGPARSSIVAVAVSPDGEFVYFVAFDSSQSMGELFRLPLLGGTPRRVLTGLNGGPGFSPDGRSISWIGVQADSGKEALMTASADGSAPREVLARRGDDFFHTGRSTPAWSADGAAIATAAGSTRDGFDAFLIITDPAGSTQRIVDEPRWNTLSAAVWLPDGSGLLVNAAAKNPSGLPRPWLVRADDGNAVPLLTDASPYYDRTLSVSSDNSRVLLVRQDFTSSIWTLPLDNPGSARRITDGAQRRDGRLGLAWTPDGDLLYTSDVTGSTEIWRMRTDGGGRTQISSDTLENNGLSMSADGRTIYFGAPGTKLPTIWRMNADGTGTESMTSGEDYGPHISPDGKWVYFDGWRDGGRRRVLRVPAGGGATEKVSELIADAPNISADGRLAFCRVYDPQRKDFRPGVISTATGALVRYLDLPPGAVQRDAPWINGDSEVLIVVSRDGIGNLWAVNVRTGALRQITRYDSEEIATVAVSHDRKRAAIVRGVPSSDLVLLQRTTGKQ